MKQLLIGILAAASLTVSAAPITVKVLEASQGKDDMIYAPSIFDMGGGLVKIVIRACGGIIEIKGVLKEIEDEQRFKKDVQPALLRAMDQLCGVHDAKNN